MLLAGFASRSIVRRPLRSSLTVLGVAVAVASLLAIRGVSSGVERGWVNALLERGTHLLAVRKGTANILSGGVDAALKEPLLKVDGVADVAGELVDMVPLDGAATTLVAGWEPSSSLWSSVRLEKGRLPDPGEADAAMLGISIAASLGKRPGDALVINGRGFRITGLFRQGSALGNNLVVLQLPAFQDLKGSHGSLTDFNIKARHPESPGALKELTDRLSREFPQLAFTPTTEVAEKDDILKLLRAVSWAMSFVALAMAGLIVMNTLLMSVTERTREIGILSSLGWSAGRIVAMILLEGFLLAIVGALLGIGLGLAWLSWLAGHPRLSPFMDLRFSPTDAGTAVTLAVALGLLAAAYPALRAIRVPPVEALRHE